MDPDVALAPGESGDRTSRFTRSCETEECRTSRCEHLKETDLEILACIAARLSGQDPDQYSIIKIGDVVAYDGVMWRYPDFMARAEAAYRILASDHHPETAIKS